MTSRTLRLIAAAAMLPLCLASPAQIADSSDGEVAGIPVNYTEARAGTYALPDPLALPDGERVGDADTWFDVQRPRIHRLVEENQFGRAPGRPEAMRFEVSDGETPAFDGRAVRRQVTIHFSDRPDGPSIDLLYYTPIDADGPVPLLLNLSFSPNSQTITAKGSSRGRSGMRRHVNAFLPERSAALAVSTRGR